MSGVQFCTSQTQGITVLAVKRSAISHVVLCMAPKVRRGNRSLVDRLARLPTWAREVYHLVQDAGLPTLHRTVRLLDDLRLLLMERIAELVDQQQHRQAQQRRLDLIHQNAERRFYDLDI